MGYIKTILNRPVAVLLIIFSIVVFGLFSVGNIRMEYFPNLDMPMEVVMVTYPGADADSISKLVAKPIEDAAKSLTGIHSIESSSYENYATIQLTYDYGTDLDDAYMELKAELDNLSSDLPEGCHTPKIMEVGLDNDATITLSAKAVDGSDITDQINDSVVPALENLAGVAKVDCDGISDEYVKITVNKEKMEQYRLSMSDISEAIKAGDFDMPLGTISSGSQDIAAIAYSEINWRNSLTSLCIRTDSGALVRLTDVADIDGLLRDDPESISRYNGMSSILIKVTKKSTAPTMKMCRDVQETIAGFSDDTIEYEVVSSAADDILDNLLEVLKTLAEGVIITMIILFIFLGDIKASLIVGSSMPLSLFMALICLNLFGVPFDLMTGTGMIVAIGMLVDNSIVVLESCFRKSEEGQDHKSAAISGASEMMMSVFGSTLTTIVVYAPISLATGMSGQMNKPLCYTIMLTMLASLINSVTTVPLLFYLIKPEYKKELKVNKLLSVFGRGYESIIPRFLKHPMIVITAAVILLIFSLMLAGKLDFDIFPPSYDGSIKVTADFRSGTKLEVMDEKIREIEEELLSDEGFRSVELSINKNGAEIKAYAVADSKRSSGEAVDYYNRIFDNITDADIDIVPFGVSGGLASLMQTGDGETITLEADDLKTLEKGADLMEDTLRSIPGVLNVHNTFASSRTTLRFHIDQQMTANAGLTPQSVAGFLYNMINGITAATIDTDDGESYDIKLTYREGEYEDPAVLMSQYIGLPSGKSVALKDICTPEYTQILQTVKRQNGKYIAEIKALTDSRFRYALAAQVKDAAENVPLPDGVSLTRSSLDETLMNEMGTMGQAVVIAIFLVFLVMAVQFESVRFSVMVMMCIPFSMIGSFGLMFILGQPISMMAMMGILMLVGMVVNNGILLVDGTNELLKSMDKKTALIQAGLTRLRPVLMTTLTTVLSMLPLLLSTESGMNMMKGLGAIVIGGLITSTILAMFMMPTLYLLISKKENLGSKS